MRPSTLRATIRDAGRVPVVTAEEATTSNLASDLYMEYDKHPNYQDRLLLTQQSDRSVRSGRMVLLALQERSTLYETVRRFDAAEDSEEIETAGPWRTLEVRTLDLHTRGA